jgi:hypothetical protein
MRNLTQIESRHLTITVDHTNDKDTLQCTTKSEQAHISMPVNDMNPSRIYCFRET